MTTEHDDPTAVREQVREHYAQAARQVAGGAAAGCCSGPIDPPAVRFYTADEVAALPAQAVQASLGCGNPTMLADLHEGETVLDLGSGGGIDCLVSARRVGPTGTVYGVDMTDEMLELARRNAAEAGATNVHFLRGSIEAVPLPDGSVDVVISNCVVNLSTDKRAVLAEMKRVLRPGGRIAISDVVAEDRLTPAERRERGSHASCIAGALSRTEYLDGLRDAGFEEVSVTFTDEYVDGIHAAAVRARRPGDGAAVAQAAPEGMVPIRPRR